MSNHGIHTETLLIYKIVAFVNLYNIFCEGEEHKLFGCHSSCDFRCKIIIIIMVIIIIIIIIIIMTIMFKYYALVNTLSIYMIHVY